MAEFLAAVIRRTGLLEELDADLERGRAETVKRNLAAFLDEVHAFSPLEGETTLRAFLDYVDLVEASEKQEWSPVQPSTEDSVKVMTIHQAKGLEFDTVFVPGLATGILPDLTIQHNPAERGKSMDFELRGDAAILPAFEGNLSKFREALKAQEMIEERRLCYVALTRARRQLFVTAAHWYGDEVGKPKLPSAFFEELADWGEATGEATVDRGTEPDEDNPLVGYRERFVRDWPGPARPDESDALFPGGWRRAAAAAAAAADGNGGTLPGAGPAGVEPARLSLEGEEAAALRRRGRPQADARPAPPRAGEGRRRERDRRGAVHRVGVVPHGLRGLPEALLLVGGAPAAAVQRPGRAARHARPRVDRAPLGRTGGAVRARRAARPRPRGADRRAGNGGAPARDLPGEPVQPGAAAVHRAALPALHRRARRERAHRRHLRRAGRRLGGRGLQDRPATARGRSDVAASSSTCTRSRACRCGARSGEELTLTYFYLSSGEEIRHEAGDPEEVRARVAAWLHGIAAGTFDPAPSDQCRWCDFLSFCDAGRGFVEAQG